MTLLSFHDHIYAINYMTRNEMEDLKICVVNKFGFSSFGSYLRAAVGSNPAIDNM